MVEVVAPVLHSIFPVQILTVSVVDSPLQTPSVEAVMVSGATPVTTGMFKVLDFTLSPQALEQVAVYEPPSTVIEFPVAPVLHLTVPVQPVASSLVLLLQSATKVSPITITGAFGVVPVPTLTVFDAELSHSSTIHFTV